MGALLALPFARSRSWPADLDALAGIGFERWGLTPSADAAPWRSLGVPERVAVVLGAEGPGLSEAALECVDRRVRITMSSSVDSLNVAAAGAIAFHFVGRGPTMKANDVGSRRRRGVGRRVLRRARSAAGHDVTLCVRTRFDELVVESKGSVLRSRPRIAVDPAEVPAPKWVLLATKAHQTEGAQGWLHAFDHAGTRIVVIQNGVEHLDRLRPLVERAEIVPTVVYCGAEAIAPGHIVHRRNGFLIVAEGAAARGLTEIYEGTGASIRATSDWTSAAWRKLCANVVANGITAITGERSTVMRRPELQQVGRELVRECAAVGRAEGAHLDDDVAEQVRRNSRGRPRSREPRCSTTVSPVGRSSTTPSTARSFVRAPATEFRHR